MGLDQRELLLNHLKYEPLPDSDDEYSDEELEDQGSDVLENNEDSETEGARKRRLSTEPRRGKRRRLNEDDVDVRIISSMEYAVTDTRLSDPDE